MPSRPKATSNLTFEQKKKICLWNEENAALMQLHLAAMAMRDFNLVKAPVQGTISSILSDRKKYLHVKAADLKCKRTRPLVLPAVDEELANWVLYCQSKSVMPSGDLIKAKAKRFAMLSGIQDDQLLSFSYGWIQAFQKRHGFRNMSAHGESCSVNTWVIPAQRDAIQERLKGVSLIDIYNMDERGLFYCPAPDKTIAWRQVEGSKKSKNRVTVALTCNADGSDEREPFIIGHANKPHCFQKKCSNRLELYYRSNLKALMTGVLFQEWLQEFDDYMRSQRRKVVLLLDNSSAHTVYGMELQTVAVLFLPSNTTSICSQ
uniref:CENPB protein Homeodomainlike putative n=1 Tax=Albugo laibachii Nc14 TaxID=890382 RepID=F0W7N7_9STRA|nr:CENPB protein Homeodomainlike putative [Albugo laibachii Nc14]|eukprot:CCA17138.1 CENPB protein Homeodomainlike putative [Albugo laibachii Nc14]